MCHDILISLHPQHCQNVMTGDKTVELRRRKLRVAPGTRMWIYAKRPNACVHAVAIIESVHEGSRSDLWRQFGDRVCISRLAFDQYLEGTKAGCAIVLRSVQPLKKAISLKEIRQKIHRFHPPQFFKRLPPGSKELVLFGKNK